MSENVEHKLRDELLADAISATQAWQCAAERNSKSLAEAEKRIAELEKLLHSWNREAENAGFAGSKYHNEPKKVFARVRQLKHSHGEAMKRRVCPSCNNAAKSFSVDRTITYEGREIAYLATVWGCEACGEQWLESENEDEASEAIRKHLNQRIAELEAKLTAATTRADNHTETLRGISSMKPEEGSRMQLWAKDGLSGYTDSLESVLLQQKNRIVDLEAKLAEVRRALATSEELRETYDKEAAAATARAEKAEHDANEAQCLFDLQRSRTEKADALWKAAHPDSAWVFPDLGTLIDWLLDRAESAEATAEQKALALAKVIQETKL